jgi:hypothetical protein
MHALTAVTVEGWVITVQAVAGQIQAQAAPRRRFTGLPPSDRQHDETAPDALGAGELASEVGALPGLIGSRCDCGHSQVSGSPEFHWCCDLPILGLHLSRGRETIRDP